MNELCSYYFSALKVNLYCLLYIFVVILMGRVLFGLFLERNKQNNLLNLDQLVIGVALSLMS